MAVPNYGDVTVSVFKNTSTVGTITASSLATKVDFAAGLNGSYDIAIADLDGDGKLDMAVVNGFVVSSATRVSVYRNTSSTGSITSGSFAAKIDLTTDTSPREIAIGDFDGDGRPDIAVMDASAGAGANAVAVFKNTSTPGAISFAAKVEFITGALSGALALGDLDGDGKVDMAVANGGSNTVSVLRNTSSTGVINTSSFAAKVDFATGTSPAGVAIGDLDGDGKPELTVTNSGSNTVSVFRNTSSTGVITASSFTSKIDFNTGSSPRGVTLGDLNGDAKLDMVVGTPINSTVSIFKNTSSPGSITVSSFDAKIDFTSGLTNEAAIGDIDGDGKPELVCASNANSTVSILRYTSTPQVPTITSFNPSSGLTGSSVVLTGTNFSATSANNIVYFGATKATVTTATANQLTVTVPTGATYQPISVTVNGLSAYSSKPFIVTFPGNQIIDANSFAAKVDYAAGTNPYYVALGDLDGDGKTDVAVPNYGEATVSLFKNNSSAGAITASSLATKVDFPAGLNASHDIKIADLDGDGKLDLAVVNAFVVGGATRVSVYKNTSSIGAITASSFAAKIDLTTDTSPRAIAIGDFDGDGKPDIAVVDASGGAGANAVAVFKNTSTPGAISFAAKVEFITGALSGDLALGDLDGDGKVDMVVANAGSNTVSVLRNTSSTGVINSGSFAAKVDLPFGTGGLAIGDLDGDGKPELTAIMGGSNAVSVFRNISSSGTINAGSFAAKVDFSTGTGPGAVSIGDMNGDGKPDLVITTSPNTVSIFTNTSTSGSITASSFAGKIDFTSGQTNKITIGDIDGDGKPDLVCASSVDNTVSILRNTSLTPKPNTLITLLSICQETNCALLGIIV